MLWIYYSLYYNFYANTTTMKLLIILLPFVPTTVI